MSRLISQNYFLRFLHIRTTITQALATLSSSSSSAEGQAVSKGYLFGLGVRWGIGHSTGLLLVGGIFILKDVIERDNNDDNDDGSQNDSDRVEIPDSLTHLFESFVGVFMLLLGFYGIHEAHKVRNREYTTLDQSSNGSSGSREDPVDYGANDGFFDEGRQSPSPLEIEAAGDSSDNSDNSDNASPTVRDGPINPHRQGYEEMDDDLEEFRYNVQVMLGTVSTGDEGAESSASNRRQDHHHHHNHSNSPFLALCAGIFHGLAGPGGVLGVVPAIQLHNAGLAACYLLSFCASTIVTMGTFASAYGTFTVFLARCCSRRSTQIRVGTDNNSIASEPDTAGSESEETLESSSSDAVAVVEFWIRCASASLSVLVGVTWLVLLAMGKLEDVFG
jgi:hypothetical protein